MRRALDGFFRAISPIDGMIFNQWIYGHVSTHYTLIFITIATSYGVFFMSVCCVVKEGEYPPPAQPETPPSEHIIFRFFAQVARYFRECCGNRYYVSVFFLLMMLNLTFVPVNTFNVPFSTGLHVDEKLYGHYLFLMYATSLCLAPILGWLVDIFHPIRMVLATLVAYMQVTIWGGFFAVNSANFLIALCLRGVISGHMFRLTYFVGFAFSEVALLLALFVYRSFCHYGGTKNYVAAELRTSFACGHQCDRDRTRRSAHSMSQAGKEKAHV